jgi:hypothetical protein
MTQLSLFDDGPQLSRQSDPVTSQVAAEEVRPKIGQLQQAFLAALAAIGKPATANEVGARAVAMGLAGNAESVRKRSAEVERAGMIRVVGIQRCSVTGKLAESWQPTSN